MRRIMICCFAFLIGISCAVGCGRTGAETEEAVSAQDGRTDTEEEASRAEAGEAEQVGEEAAKAEDSETKDGQTRTDGGKAGKEDAVGTEDDMTASDHNGTDGKAAHGNQDGNADKAQGGEGNGASSETGTKEAGGEDRPNIWGALSVEGTQLVDGEGHPVQLKGISTHGLAWYPQYVNQECFRQLKEEWGMDVIRLAMYTAESGGYCTDGNQEDLKALVRDGVEYATDCGLYVIIDWHVLSDGNPNTYLEEAKAFFREMSEAYADYDNVIYEICNEPNGGTSWSEVKRYAEEIIPVIRANDGEGIILVGTPNWCQYVDQAAADPITGYDNIMYTLHFYAATHTDSLRKAMVDAVEAGLPVFVSEYGICDASGNGAIDENQADRWVDAMNEKGISYVAWNLSNKSETSAILKSGCGKVSGFEKEDLSDSGRWLYGMLEEAGAAGGPGGGGTGAGTGSSSGTADGNAGGIEAGGLEVKAEVVNSWGQGSETCFQYELTLSNATDSPQKGWMIRLTFSSDITLQNGWNGNYEADGNVLNISSMDYNARIEKGGSVGDIGFIIQTAADCTLGN